MRNAPLLPVMTLYSIGLALSIALAMRGVSGTVTLAGISLPAGTVVLAGVAVAIVLAVAIVGSVGIVVIALTRDRQRVGDLWAGTWVVRRLREAAPPAS